MWTRKQYMNKEVTHDEYYLAIAKKCGISYINSTMLPEIIESINLGDTHLNYIQLSRWDYLAIMSQSIINRVMREYCEDYWTLSGAVCVHKAAARQAGLDAIKELGHD